MHVKIRKTIAFSMIAVLLVQLTACGTIIYPERKGQISGRIDGGVVALNAIGLLFFFVPGVIAFAVDFNNGTIYLPGGSSTSIHTDEVDIVNVDGDVTNERIEKIILEKTGKVANLNESNVQSFEKMTTLSALKNDVKFL